jgi:hypothetical protein
MYALLLFMLLYLQLMQNKTCCPDALFPFQKNPLVDLPFCCCFFLFCHWLQHSSFDNERIASWDLQKLVVHAADLLTVDGLFLFKVVEALWEGTYLPGTLHARKKGGGQKWWWTKWWLFENRTCVIDQNQLFEAFENHGYISESVL